MYPSKGDLHIAPFTDDALFMEQTNKASFWYVKYFVKYLINQNRSDNINNFNESKYL